MPAHDNGDGSPPLDLPKVIRLNPLYTDGISKPQGDASVDSRISRESQFTRERILRSAENIIEIEFRALLTRGMSEILFFHLSHSQRIGLRLEAETVLIKPSGMT